MTTSNACLSRFFLLALLGAGAACASTSTTDASGGGPAASAPAATPSAEPGTTPGAPGSAPTAPPVLLAVAQDHTAGASGAVFDGTTWKVHAFPSEKTPASNYGEVNPVTAVASDGTGLVVLGGGDAQPLRFARWKGGESWTDLAPVPKGRAARSYAALAFRNGVFVLAYVTDKYGYVYQVYDPKADAWAAPAVLLPDYEATLGASPGPVRLEPSATGADELFIAIQKSGYAYGVAWKPSFSGPPAAAPTELVAALDGSGPLVSPVLTPAGGDAVQISFLEDPHRAAAVNVIIPGTDGVPSLGGCDAPFDVLVTGGSHASVLCRGYQDQALWETAGDLAAGSPPELAWKDRRATIPNFDDRFDYLPGIGTDTSYVVGITKGSAVLVRNLSGPGEPFTPGYAVGASVGPAAR